MPSGAHWALGRSALPSSSQGVAVCQRRFLSKLSSPNQLSPPRRGASPPTCRLPLRAWFAPRSSGFLPQRRTLRRPQTLYRGPGSPEAPVAAGAAKLGRRDSCQYSLAVQTRSGCSPCSSSASRVLSAHAGLARWPEPGPCTRLGNLRHSLAPGPAGARPNSGSQCVRESLGSLLQIPKPEEKRARQVGARGDPLAGEGDRPKRTPQSLTGLARCALTPAPGSKHNSRAFVWLSAPAARSRGAPCAPSSLCPCLGPRVAQSARLAPVTPLAAAPNPAWISRQSLGERREPARERAEPASS